MVAVSATKSSSSRLSRRGRPPAHRGTRQASPSSLNRWITSRTVSSFAVAGDLGRCRLPGTARPDPRTSHRPSAPQVPRRPCLLGRGDARPGQARTLLPEDRIKHGIAHLRSWQALAQHHGHQVTLPKTIQAVATVFSHQQSRVRPLGPDSMMRDITRSQHATTNSSRAREGYRRWVIERMISWLTSYRQLNRRYQRHPTNGLALLGSAAAICCHKRLVRLTKRPRHYEKRYNPGTVWRVRYCLPGQHCSLVSGTVA